MTTMSFTPWRQLLARADEALTEERKAQALAEPFALLESLMQITVRKWAGDRRHRMKRQATSGWAIPTRAPEWVRESHAPHAGL